MKKFLSFIFALMMCLTAQAAITDLKLSTSQIFDVQWNISGGTLNASGFNYIYSAVNYANQTNSAARWTAAQTADASANGRYIGFFNSTTNPGTYGMAVFNRDGSRYKIIDNTGTFSALANGAIFYNGNNQWGTLITTGQGYTNGQSGSWAVTTSNPSNAQLQAYVPPSSTPLAAGQTAQPSPPPPTNYTTTAGTMPGGYIGRILNNVPGQSQNYSFTYTPGQTGSQYVQLAFRQDPAYWSVTNVSLTASGSSTNLLQNGNFATGGSITAQTNNGPMSVNTPTNWGVAYQSGIYPGAAGNWSPGQWYDGAVGSFDAIYQGVTLTAGVTYTVTVTVAGDNTSDNNLDGGVQLGVYAAACGSLTLSPDQCTLPSNSGYTTLATPQEGASAGGAPAAPTETGSSTSNSVSSTSSVGSTITVNNPYTFGNQTYRVIGTSTPTTITTTTTPITTHYWSDNTTTTTNGNSTTTTNTTWNYTVTGPTNPPVSPYVGTNVNGVYITQTNAGSNNNVTANQSGHGNYDSISLGGSNNNIKAGQGYTFNGAGVTSESSTASNYNVSGLTVSGNGNGITGSQIGLSNSSIISVTGNTNTSIIGQTGNNNQVYSIVSGNNNALTVAQTGNGNIASANLFGNNNNATVSQTGNNHGTVLSLVNAGGANTVSVIQTGAGDAYSLQQICTNPVGCSVSVIRNK